MADSCVIGSDLLELSDLDVDEIPPYDYLRQEAGRDSWAIYCLNRIFT